MDPIELVAAATGLICVLLVAMQSVWNFPIGLLNSVLYAYVFFGAKLYSDVLLQGCFFALQCYGWYNWLAGRRVALRDEAPADEELPPAYGEPTLLLPVTRLTSRQWAGWLAAIGVGTGTLGYLMENYAGAAAPYRDAFIASASLVAQYLIARKKLENWLIWVVVDVVAVGVYYQQNLIPTAVLYVLFTGMAVAGYFRWRADARRLA